MLTSVQFVILVLLNIGLGSAISDGFNIYKDLLRKQNEEIENTEVKDETPKMYFYRAPKFIFIPGPDETDVESSDIGKRNSNHFKSIMLNSNREALDEDQEGKPEQTEIFHFPRVPVKKKVPAEITTFQECFYRYDFGCFPIFLKKRGPGSLLSWAFSSKNPPQDSGFLQQLLHPENRAATRNPGTGKQATFFASMGKRPSSHDSTVM